VRGIPGFLKTTIAGGSLIVLPVVLIWLIVSETIDLLVGPAVPLSTLISDGTFKHVDTEWLAAVLLMVLICFFTRLAMRFGPGRRVGGWLEAKILRPIPGYSVFKDLTRRLSGDHDGWSYRPALIAAAPGVKSLAFIVEDHEDGNRTVSVPLAPTPTIGNIHIVHEDHLEELPVSTSKAINTHWHWGSGAADLFKK
jgi:uncharacterized membrane protein